LLESVPTFVTRRSAVAVLALTAAPLSVLAAADNAHAQVSQTMPEKSLYERLGGVFAIAAVVDHFSDTVVKNPIVGQTSKNSQLREDGSPAKPNPAFKPHPMQGWSPDFIPKITGDAVEMGVISRILTIAGPDAMKWSRELAQKEGIFVGITAGATFAGALEACKNAKTGDTVLCMLPDTGERYLSTPLFNGIGVDMSENELNISNSTPNYRLPSKAA